MWSRVSKISPLNFIVMLAVFTIAFAAIINSLLKFDGIEFNGDSHVYFQMAKYFKQTIQDLTSLNPQHWPYGYPALVAITFFFGSEKYETAQWINLIAGGVLVAVLGRTALLIARIKNLKQEDLFYFILATVMMMFGHAMMLKYQLLLMSDMMGALWATFMILLVWRWKISDSYFTLLWAGITLGLAISTRYVYVMMLLPACVVLLDGFSWRKIFFNVLIFGLALLVAVLPQMIITFKDTSPSLGNGLLNGWSVRNFFTLEFESGDGYQTSNLPSILYYAALPFRWEDFSPFSFPLICMGVYYAVHELPRWLWLSLVVWYFSFYILLCGIPIQNSRIAFSLYQPLAIFTSLGILWCLLRWRAKWVVAGLSVLTVVAIIFSVYYIRNFVEGKNDLKNTAVQVANVAQKDSRVISTSLYAVYLAYPLDIEPLSIYTLSIPQVQMALSDGRKTFMAIDEEKFIPQWSNYPAGKTYWWIRNHYECTFVMKADGYTVYRIK